MGLENYSSGAITSIQRQAYDHIFMGNDVNKSVDDVLHFEECTHQKIINLELIYEYICQLASFRALYPRISDNIKSYVSYAIYHKSFVHSKRAVDMQWLNGMLSVNRANERGSNAWYFKRRLFYSALNIKDYAGLLSNAFLQDKNDKSKQLFDFVSGQFDITALMLEGEHDFVYSLSGKEEFLRYINYLIHFYPSLIHEEDFLGKVYNVLIYNKDLSDYTYDNGEDVVSESFLHYNQKSIRKVKAIGKSEGIHFI